MRSFCVFAACGFLTLCVPGPILANDSYFANDDAFLLIGGTSLSLPESELLSNDAVHPTAVLSLTTLPEHGDLLIRWVEDKQILTYTPDSGFHGRDFLTYDVGGLQARALLYVSPPKAPIIGRWPTPTCHPPATEIDDCPDATELGHGVEIGWYDAVAELFRLCDWQGQVAADCIDLPLPETDAIAAAGWIPLTLDVEGDAWDELALRHPLTGETRIYAILPDAGLIQPAKLVQIDLLTLGGPGDLPVTGRWTPTPGPSQLGVYAFDSRSGAPGELLLDIWNGGGELGEPLAAPFARPWPLAGDWLGKGYDQVGGYDLDGSGLWFVDLESRADHAFDVTTCGDFTAFLPVAGRTFRGAARGFLGLVEPDLTRLYLFESLDECIGDPFGPLPREIVIDPSTDRE